MYASINKLEEFDWNIKKYLKEYAVRSYGLCISLRDDNRELNEHELRDYFRGQDARSNYRISSEKEVPVKKSTEELLSDYKGDKDYCALEISRASSDIRNLMQIIEDIRKGLLNFEGDELDLDDAESIAYNSLKTLKDNVESEIESLRNYIEQKTKELFVSFSEYQKKYEEYYSRQCERIKEKTTEEKEASNLLGTYEEFVKIVNDLDI